MICSHLQQNKLNAGKSPGEMSAVGSDRASDFTGESGEILDDEGDEHYLVAKWLCRMQLTDERFLRATLVCRVLEFAGGILRKKGRNDFRHSQAVKEIQKFISHSWQASALSKTLTLLYYYNWKPAVIVSNMLAALMMLLFTFGLLPGFTKVSRWDTDPQYLGPWCISVGILSFLLVLVFHPPRELVFLDRICINQSDPKEKTQGVLNIGACLKHSRKLFVIWESTYSERFLGPRIIHDFASVAPLCLFHYDHDNDDNNNKYNVMLVAFNIL